MEEVWGNYSVRGQRRKKKKLGRGGRQRGRRIKDRRSYAAPPNLLKLVQKSLLHVGGGGGERRKKNILTKKEESCRRSQNTITHRFYAILRGDNRRCKSHSKTGRRKRKAKKEGERERGGIKMHESHPHQLDLLKGTAGPRIPTSPLSNGLVEIEGKVFALAGKERTRNQAKKSA